ncbi:MAG: metallophosphoesterase [Candidatus Nanohalobium sp.]
MDSLPALYHPEIDTAVISDLHLGLEEGMTSKGSYIPQFQLETILSDLEKIKEETEAFRLVVNGDLKNEFKTSLYAEKSETKDFLEKADSLFSEVVLIKGNHDTFIESAVEEEGFELEKYFLKNSILFTHGHISLKELEVNSDKFKTVIIGHEHPALELKDDIGVKEKVNCFLYGKNSEGKGLVVLPAFSTISQGSGVNNMPSRELLSPVLRNFVDKNELEAVAVSREAGLFKFPELKKL